MQKVHVLIISLTIFVGAIASADLDSVIPTWCGNPNRAAQICLLESVNGDLFIRDRIYAIAPKDQIYTVTAVRDVKPPNIVGANYKEYAGVSAQCESDRCVETRRSVTLIVPVVPNPTVATGKIINEDGSTSQFEMRKMNLSFPK